MAIEYTDLNWFDYIVFLVVFLSTIIAFFKGFIKTFFSLINWIGAAITVYMFHETINNYLSSFIASENMVTTLSVVGLYILAFIGFAIVNSIFVHLLRNRRHGIIDRTLGFAFGLIRGVLIVSIVFLSISISSAVLGLGEEAKGPTWFQQAKTHDLLEMSTHYLLENTPEHVSVYVNNLFDEFDTLSGIIVATKSFLEDDTELSSDMKQTLISVLTVIPNDQLDSIISNYGQDSDIDSPDRISTFLEIINSYEQSVIEGKIDDKHKIAPEQIKILKLELLRLSGLNIQQESLDDVIEPVTVFEEMNKENSTESPAIFSPLESENPSLVSPSVPSDDSDIKSKPDVIDPSLETGYNSKNQNDLNRLINQLN